MIDGRRVTVITCFALVFFHFLLTVSNPNYPLFDKNTSKIVLSKEGEVMRVFLDDNDQLRFPAVEDLPEKLVEAVITFEDKRFYYHPGVDPIAVLRAIITDIKAGKIVSGASTIPMQLVRLSENRDRTFLNKMIEMLKALRIDAYYSKRQILSLYLNNAPYGGNIIGYQGACHKYFGKSG
ncbi:MAG: transglycosylase domain-containing protein, partial [Candidatus Muiribacteriaceae bacterium]